MAGVPDHVAGRRVEHPMQRDRELDRAEARGDVPARLLHALDRELADLLAEREQLVPLEHAEIPRMTNAVEHAHTSILGRVFDLSKRAVVLTGGTGNLGPSVARAYLAQGAHLAAAVRDVAKGEQLRVALADLAGDRDDPRLVVIAADPADRAAMDRLAPEVGPRWGRLGHPAKPRAGS